MSEASPRLSLPYIQPSQNQKHVTHNEAILRLDAIVQLGVASRSLAVPPASPAADARYIVAAGPGGDWDGQGGRVALWQDGTWGFVVPQAGWRAWISDEGALAVFDGGAWVAATATPETLPLLGINATADATNRLSLSAPATLLNNAGAGHQLKINKAGAGDTASLLYQTGFSGRAEMGLAGSDDFTVKVSADGAAWTEALAIARADGTVRLAAGLRLGSVTVAGLLPAAAAGTLIFVPDESGGAVVAFSDGTDWRRMTDRAVVS